MFIIDKQGIIRYIDIHDIDDQPYNEELRKELRKIDPEAAAKEIRPEPVREFPQGGVVVYCTPWCPDCKNARAWMKEHNLPFTEVDIYSTQGAEERVRAWNNGKMITPTFDLDGTIFSEFVEEAAVPLLSKYLK